MSVESQLKRRYINLLLHFNYNCLPAGWHLKSWVPWVISLCVTRLVTNFYM